VRLAESWHDDDRVTDEALLSAIAIGDTRASIVFVRRYQRRLFGIAMGIVGDSAIAEDVAQEAFIRIFRHAEVFDTRRGPVSAWALTIARNLAIDVLRAHRDTPAEPDDQIFLQLMSTERAPDETAAVEVEMVDVRSAIAQLPIEQRHAVLLAAMYGWSATEIAAAQAIPLGTAKGRIRLGMARLRGELGVDAR
jgi:RNA polymerase sigma factor (sigma-70 family)